MKRPDTARSLPAPLKHLHPQAGKSCRRLWARRLSSWRRIPRHPTAKLCWSPDTGCSLFQRCLPRRAFRVRKRGIVGMPKSALPNLKRLMIERGYLPILVIFYTLLNGRTPMRALLGIAVSFLVSLFRRDTRMSFKSVLGAMEQGARALSRLLRPVPARASSSA